MENGMSKAEAEEEAVRQMGNPEEAGNELNQIHARVLDFSMFWWMMFFAFLVPVFEVISRLVTAGKYGIVGFLNEYQQMDKIPLQVHLVVGTAILCYGIILSIWEKYSGKELFYAYGRNWKGSYLTNSGTVMALAGLMCSAASPVRGFVKGLIGVFAATEGVMMKAVENGGNRQELHEVIREASIKAKAELEKSGTNPLKTILSEDKRLLEYLKKDEILTLLSTSPELPTIHNITKGDNHDN